MKTKLVITVLFFAVAVPVLAQSQLKGPAYKNAEPSRKYEGEQQILVRTSDAETLKGPEAKNTNIAKKDNATHELIKLDQFSDKETKTLKGPAYKNRGPQRKPRTNN